jgi:hypothetical protein
MTNSISSLKNPIEHQQRRHLGVWCLYRYLVDALAASTTRLGTLGETRTAQAVPRIRLILPWSQRCGTVNIFYGSGSNF